MEHNEIQQNLNFEEPPFSITPRMRDFLSEAARWSRFIAIVGFVMMGLAFLINLISLIFLGGAVGIGGGLGIIMPIVSMIFLGIFLIPLFYLFNFGKHMREALQSENDTVLLSSFENLKSYFKFTGIFTLVIIVLYGLILLIALGAGGLGAFMG